jgi:hypothetical protein
MSGPEAFPPPGAEPPPMAPPMPREGWTVPPPAPPAPPPGWGVPVHQAAHKPGAIPLRPLALGDIYNGAFKIIRVNPGATVGSAALVSSVAMAVPLLVAALLALAFDLGSWTDGELSEAEALQTIGSIFSSALGGILQSFGLIFVTSMVAHVAVAAAAGRKLSMAEAWAQTRGRRWCLVLLSLFLGTAYVLVFTGYVLLWVLVAVTAETAVIVIWGLVTVPAFICLMVLAYVRIYYLAVPPLMIERRGVFGAIGRAHALTRKQFWRTFGIALLTAIITGVASGILSVPVTMVGSIAPLVIEGSPGVFAMLILQSLGTILSTAFVAPFSAAVVSLQYLDQRMRKEAYDVELLSQAGYVSA